MSATPDGMGELQAFLNAHPRRLYRQGVGSIPIKAIRASLRPTRSESQPVRGCTHCVSLPQTRRPIEVAAETVEKAAL